MIDLGLRAAALGAGVLLVLAAVAGIHHHGFEEGYAKRSAEEAPKTEARQNAVINRQSEVIADNQAKDDKAEKVDHETQDRLARAVADRNRAQSAAAGLRDELDRVRADAMSETATRSRLAAEVSTLADVFSECSRRRSEVAEVADGLSIQVSGLLELTPQ